MMPQHDWLDAENGLKGKETPEGFQICKLPGRLTSREMVLGAYDFLDTIISHHGPSI
jgi:hypothetical protein